MVRYALPQPIRCVTKTDCFLNSCVFRQLKNYSSECCTKSGIALLFIHSVLWLVKKKSRHPLIQLDARLKLIASWPLAFSRASKGWLGFTLGFHWLILMLIFVLMGRCNCTVFSYCDSRSTLALRTQCRFDKSLVIPSLRSHFLRRYLNFGFGFLAFNRSVLHRGHFIFLFSLWNRFCHVAFGLKLVLTLCFLAPPKRPSPSSPKQKWRLVLVCWFTA